MTIAPTLQKYLADNNVAYDLVPHQRTLSSLRTAEACHIPGDRLAKGVVLRDSGGYWLAVLPASRQVRLSDLKTSLGDQVDLASEQEIEQVFPDCERGAVPPVGACYGLDVIVDDSLDRQSDVYFEGGDHATLVHMSRDEFARLNGSARHGSFTGPS
jgi:Ala-tRNA(Pro) deacylase